MGNTTTGKLFNIVNNGTLDDLEKFLNDEKMDKESFQSYIGRNSERIVLRNYYDITILHEIEYKKRFEVLPMILSSKYMDRDFFYKKIKEDDDAGKLGKSFLYLLFENIKENVEYYGLELKHIKCMFDSGLVTWDDLNNHDYSDRINILDSNLVFYNNKIKELREELNNPNLNPSETKNIKKEIDKFVNKIKANKNSYTRHHTSWFRTPINHIKPTPKLKINQDKMDEIVNYVISLKP